MRIKEANNCENDWLAYKAVKKMDCKLHKGKTVISFINYANGLEQSQRHEALHAFAY
jgi:hypothetical protein